MESRSSHRQEVAHQGAIEIRGMQIPVDFADISRGGCKMRATPQIVEMLAKAVPLEVTVVCGEMSLSATILWAANMLLGSSFANQLSLDEVAALMAGRARHRG
jgi:hypothetical protein